MERVWSTTRRGFSVRSILTFVLTVFITALLWVTFGSHVETHAVDAPVATWKGESILYDGRQYFSAGDAKAGDSIGLPVGTHYYFYTPDTNGAAPKMQKAFVIYFASGTDPPKEKTAAFASYDYSSAKVYSNQTDKKTIDITPQGAESSYSACTIQGIGWIICPITTFLADGMDNIFNIVKGFLVVQPANTTNPNNDLYVAWNIIRGFANVAFIIVFLIIIYSQLTNMGISNYGLKKLLPRLIIAAVLVNVSYIICAIALDVSNILGYSLQDLFNTIRQNTFNINNDTWSNSSSMGWSAVTAFVLSGGAVTAGVIIATGGTVAAAIYLLIPVLIGLLGTILVVLLILAARQAIIVILIVIAPLAFVAYLLPNTEQWFKKWRELFMTMLVFFPAFSLVFGGSQLAGGIIIQNATSIIGVIFGLAVQVAPLIVTPLLLRLSGGLLGKIAGIVNDPKKGLMDRTKTWSGDRAAMHRQRGLRDNNLKWFNGARGIARALDNNNRTVKNRTSQYTNEADNRYNRSTRYAGLYEQAHETETEKKRIENTLEGNLNRKIATTPHLFETQLNAANVTDRASEAKLALENALKEAKAGHAPVYGPQTARMTNLINEATSVTKGLAAQTARGQSADSETQKMIAQAFNIKLAADKSNRSEFLASQALLRVAGGIQGSVGITRAQANATAALAKIEAEAVDNNLKLLSSQAILDGSTLKIHTDKIVRQVLAGRGQEYEKSVIEAALEAQAQEGQIALVEDARGSSNFDQSSVNKVIARNVPTMKSKGGFHLQADPDLNIEYFLQKNNGNEAAAEAEFKNKLLLAQISSLGDTSANNITDLKAGWLDRMATLFTGANGDETMRAVRSDPTGKAEAALRAAQENFDLALKNPQVRATIGDRIPDVTKIRNRLDNEFGPVTNEVTPPPSNTPPQNP
jgi:hypothetical protein